MLTFSLTLERYDRSLLYLVFAAKVLSEKSWRNTKGKGSTLPSQMFLFHLLRVVLLRKPHILSPHLYGMDLNEPLIIPCSPTT